MDSLLCHTGQHIAGQHEKSAHQACKKLFRALAADGALHARFLNTLSLMEHIGSRKIMASQPPDGEVIQHLAEETRHALFFKRLAERRAGRTLNYADEDLVAGPEARAYMQRLDGFIACNARGRAAYLAMSLAIELRATWFYRLYETALEPRLAGILAEEQKHLADMRKALADLPAAPDLGAILAEEEKLFTRLMAALLSPL
jgi:hypothetical protein